MLFSVLLAKVTKKGIAQVLQGVKAGKTLVYIVQVTIEIIVFFDPGGGTFGVPILEDSDDVIEAILKAIANLFPYITSLFVDNSDDHHLKATIHDITSGEFGLSHLGFYVLIGSHHSDSIRVDGAPDELWRKN